MLFRLENENTSRHTHCGVLEFTAPEGSVYLPYWVNSKLLKQNSTFELIKFHR